MFIDIREQEEEVEGIRFDNSRDLLTYKRGLLVINKEYIGIVELAGWGDFDNFIAALHKARELWGPK